MAAKEMVESLQWDLERAQNQIVELGALLKYAEMKSKIYEDLWEESMTNHEQCASRLIVALGELEKNKAALKPGRN